METEFLLSWVLKVMLHIDMNSTASKRKGNPRDSRQQLYISPAQACTHICPEALGRRTAQGGNQQRFLHGIFVLAVPHSSLPLRQRIWVWFGGGF